jgi:hypothetical protein
MCKHETKNCPRCQQVFECKTGDIAHCQCNTVSLTLAERSFIEERYTDCLCADCLRDLTNKFVFFTEKYLLHGK